MPALLFLCSGNTCRSPMAEALCKARLVRAGFDLTDWRVESAGTSAVENQPASSEALQVMAERGLDLSTHRSRPIHPQRLAEFDLVLCMETSHLAAFSVRFPAQAAKAHLLSQMSAQSVNIADPYGQPLAAYERTAQEIDGWLERGWSTILQKLQPR